ncbi:serine/threonine protein kinase [Aerosakkonema funiforme]|uniref:serine/threonine protein kinase n=1 Tax=Aerosakkonema funiforme TaxID=1246630 RepID=UPI0035B81FA3
MADRILADRYIIDRQLGKQAGRRTLLARDKHTQELVVVKLLTFSKDFEWDDLKLFEREAETLQSLSYPAIPRYLDSFELDTASGKSFALVQSYIEATSLEEHLSNGRTFSEAEFKQLAKALLEILTYLHRRQPPVIHRDIKPSNILLGDSSSNSIGQVYLVDFGSVQTLATQEGRTVTVVGTYGYMPPEQFGGRAVPASDIYSLGATLIALLTRLHPADLPQKDMRIEFDQNSNLSLAFADWLKWMTEPSLERRFNSAQSALSALEEQKPRKPYSLEIKQRKPVSTINLFWNSIWRSTVMGTLAVAVQAAIYSTWIIPGYGTFLGGIIGALTGLFVGFTNGILVGILTRLFFFPLANPKLHRQVMSAVSSLVCTAVTVASFSKILAIMLSPVFTRFSYLDIFWIIAPSVITGLSMGVVSKSIARWYERENRRFKAKDS